MNPLTDSQKITMLRESLNICAGQLECEADSPDNKISPVCCKITAQEARQVLATTATRTLAEWNKREDDLLHQIKFLEDERDVRNKERNQMSNDQINEEIAKSCGWSAIDLSNYCEDLNAMHRAETANALRRVGYSRYIESLALACGTARLGALVFSTAAQRAEAFLRTLNLWKGAETTCALNTHPNRKDYHEHT